ncbi:MAG TPA: hypothetical protein V6D19_23105, partial [Stenomitos sp.]
MVMDKLPADAMDAAQPSLETDATDASQEHGLNYRGTSYNAKANSALVRPQKAWYRWSTLGLRTKATLLAIAIGTLPPLIVGSVGYYFASQSIDKEVTATHTQKSVSAIDKLTRFVFERYGDIQVLANFPIFRDAKLNSAVSLSEKQKILTNFAETYQIYDSIAVYRLDGSLIVNGGKEKAPANIADRVYFQEALKTGKPYISQPTVSKVTKSNSVFFAAPIRDSETDKIIAIVR